MSDQNEKKINGRESGSPDTASDAAEAVSTNQQAENMPDDAMREDPTAGMDNASSRHDDSLDVDDILAGLSPDLKEEIEAEISQEMSPENKDARADSAAEESGAPEEESMDEIDLFGDAETASGKTTPGAMEAGPGEGGDAGQSFQEQLESASDAAADEEVEIELEPMMNVSAGQSDDLSDADEESPRPESPETGSSASPPPEPAPADSGESSKNGYPETGPEAAGASTGFDDDIGISLDDDELWDDSEDDIPLLDEELPGHEDSSRAVGDDASEEPAGKAGAETAAEAESPAESPSDFSEEPRKEAEQAPAPDQEALIVIGGKGPWWLPWLLTALSSCVLFAGIFVLWGMLTGAPDTAATRQPAMPGSSAKPPGPSSGSGSYQIDRVPLAVPSEVTSAKRDVRPSAAKPSLESMTLAPFIIPVQKQGELVFFKLTVELIVPDIVTKQELKKREAWVRDAIYTELKGIDVGPGLKGEFLLRYRRPLMKRIEKELAPLEIKDVRLMGYVLK